MNVDSAPRTLLVAGLVALFCSTFVSVAIHYLRPLQAAMQDIERNAVILDAGGLLPTGESTDREIAQAFLALDAQVVDLRSGWYATNLDGHTYDHWQNVETADTGDRESLDAELRYAPVYLVRKAGELQSVVLPVDGPGMWSTIHGYIALAPDLNTITGVRFHRHGETPGIGDSVQDPDWLRSWQGKRIRDDSGAVRFRVVRGASGPHEVDIVSGASVTTEAGGEIVRTWLGDDRFGPYLRQLAEQER